MNTTRRFSTRYCRLKLVIFTIFVFTVLTVPASTPMLPVDVMTLPGSNGGVYFHTLYQDVSWPEKGFEVQVNNTHGDPIKSGSLYHVKDIGADDIKGIVKDNEWFTEHIRVQGDTVTIWLNDQKVVEWTQPADWQGTSDFAGRRIGHGTIALQGHDPNSTVYYKNIRIKPL